MLNPNGSAVAELKGKRRERLLFHILSDLLNGHVSTFLQKLFAQPAPGNYDFFPFGSRFFVKSSGVTVDATPLCGTSALAIHSKALSTTLR